MPWLAAEAYDIGEEVARGGMGRVVRAVDRRLGRVVALKQLVGDSTSLRVRFVREAQITALLQHPSIVPIYEAGRWPGGGLAYAMKLVSGQPLEQAIAARSTLAERLSLLDRVVDVVDAVAYAHSQGIIHRDIKPSNIILGDSAKAS
jgi:serine/threonine protein kinase